MPKVKMNADQYAMQDFVREIRKAGVDMDIKSNNTVKYAEIAGITEKTMRQRFAHPETFKLPEIMKLIRGLRMKDEAVLVLNRRGAVK